MKEIKTEYVRIGNRVFLVEFSQGSNGFEQGINFEVFKPHTQPRTCWGRVRRFFSDDHSLADGFWYPTGKYESPLAMAIECCNEIVEKETVCDAVEKAWENLDKTP